MASTSAQKPRVTVAQLRKEVQSQSSTIDNMAESMTDLRMQLEDRGWRRWGNDYAADGIKLDTIKVVADELRSWVVGGGIMKKLAEDRGDTIYGDGVKFVNYVKAKKAFESPNNVEKLFSVDAMQEINRGHCTDGVIVLLVHKVTKEIMRFGIGEMGEPYIDGEDTERTNYVRRTYTRVTPAKPEGESVTVFYVTDTCPPKKANLKRVDMGADTFIPVDTNYTAVVWDVNRQIGWPFGLPDLLASLQWAEKYTGYLKNQDRFAEALAALAWEYKSATAAQAKAVGASIAKPMEAGGSANHTSGTEMKALPGGSAVSFENGAPLAAQAAAAAGITVDTLLAKSQSAAAQTLDPHVKKMATARRLSATAVFKRIGRLLGAPNLEVVWPDLETESPFREAQMLIAAYGQGVFEADEIRGPLAHRIRLPLEDGSKAPEDALVPNTERALKAAAAAKPEPAAATGNGTNSQGQDALGVGNLSSGDNEARDDGEVNA